MIHQNKGCHKTPTFKTFAIPENLYQQKRTKQISRMKKFTINDESTYNSYGFRVLTEGISLERFNENPICLKDHRNDTKSVLGTWANLEKDGKVLKGEVKFDTKDEDGLEVVRKVEAGIIKGCSMGLRFKHDDLVYVDKDVVLTKCELFEVSIVAIPSNANAIALYNEEGEILTEKEIKQLCLSAQTYKFNPTNNKMKIVYQHLQLADTASEADVLGAIKGIEAKLTASDAEVVRLKAEVKTIKDAKTAELTSKLTAEVETAIKDGRIDAKQKESFLKLDPETGVQLLAGLPKRNPVAGEIDGKEGENKKREAYAKLSYDELFKGNKLVALKAEFPDLFLEKSEEKYGKKPEVK